MERFVFDQKWNWRFSIAIAVLSGIAVYFFGAPFATAIIVPFIGCVASGLAQDWYRKHRGHR